MKNRLILIEGIPGSGKTTISKKIKDYLEDKGLKVKLFTEGEAHPADMAWTAYVPQIEYERLLCDNLEYAEIIKVNTEFQEDYAFVAYTRLGIMQNQNELMKYFAAHEVCDGRVGFEVFKELHFKRWKKFGECADDKIIYIFECAYLQNHVNELMGFHSNDIKSISNYMLKLIATVINLKPKLIYLNQPNVKETIERVSKVRISPDKSKLKDWIDLVIDYVEKSPYGQENQLKGFEGVVKFFQARKEIEFEVMERLPIDKIVIDNPKYDWDEVFEKVEEELN